MKAVLLMSSGIWGGEGEMGEVGEVLGINMRMV